MDATTQLDAATPLYWQFYDPLTGAPYAPTPEPTGYVYRLNEDGTFDELVAPGAALTAIAGLTGAYTLILDDSLDNALGQIIGQATTTDSALTPYPEYATRNYEVEVEGSGSVPTVQQIVDGVWDEPASDHVASGTMGLFLTFIRAQAALISSSLLRIVSPFNSITYDIIVQRADDITIGNAGGAFTIPSMQSGIDLTLATELEMAVMKDRRPLFTIRMSDAGTPIQAADAQNALVRRITSGQLSRTPDEYDYRAIATFDDGRKTFAKGKFIIE